MDCGEGVGLERGVLRHDSHDTGLDSNMGVDIWPGIFPPLRGDVSACTRQWACSGRDAASRIARHGQQSGYAYVMDMAIEMDLLGHGLR